MTMGNHPSIVGEAITKGLTPELVDQATPTARANRSALDEQELRDLEGLQTGVPQDVARPPRRSLLDRILRRG